MPIFGFLRATYNNEVPNLSKTWAIWLDLIALGERPWLQIYAKRGPFDWISLHLVSAHGSKFAQKSIQIPPVLPKIAHISLFS